MGTHWLIEDVEALRAALLAHPLLTTREVYDYLPDATRARHTLDQCNNKAGHMGLGNRAARVQEAAKQTYRTQLEQHRPDLLARADDKKDSTFYWRDANKHLVAMQEMADSANTTQHETAFGVPEATAPIFVVGICDTHIGDWATSYTVLEQITDEILSTPGLYVVLLGDLVQMAVKLRNVSEVSSNLLPPEMQMAYLDSWLAEIAPRVIAATWGNHEERQETQAGISLSRHIISKRVPYSDGLSHVDMRVGQEVYKFALTHVFRGRSMYNRTHGAGRYMRHEGQDREIAMAGDSHEPGLSMWVEGQRLRCALNGGSIQAGGYMKRHFSLLNSPAYPGVALYPDRHMFTPYWSTAAWIAAR